MANSYKQILMRKNYVPNKCLFCDNDILAPEGKRLADARNQKFCNQSCAAKYNNPRFPKRFKKPTACSDCGSDFIAEVSRSSRCPSCLEKYKVRGDMMLRCNTSHSVIRGHARAKMNGRLRSCHLCKYDKFVEACHIKPIRSFPKDATLAQINDPSNLVYLCPNCHWEFDHDMVKI